MYNRDILKEAVYHRMGWESITANTFQYNFAKKRVAS